MPSSKDVMVSKLELDLDHLVMILTWISKSLRIWGKLIVIDLNMSYHHIFSKNLNLEKFDGNINFFSWQQSFKKYK